jgi:hypothetical protein
MFRTPWSVETPLPRGWRRSTMVQSARRAASTFWSGADLPTITAALERAGFVRDELLDVIMFRDGPEGKPSEAINLLFAGEKTRSDHLLPAPEIQTVNDPANFRVISLESLILLTLTSNRRKDQVHVEDMINVGLIDASWLTKLPPELAARLKHIMDTPDD